MGEMARYPLLIGLMARYPLLMGHFPVCCDKYDPSDQRVLFERWGKHFEPNYRQFGKKKSHVLDTWPVPRGRQVKQLTSPV